jgi:heme/copper-type cytochrome/quinol oxidase subunit 2
MLVFLPELATQVLVPDVVVVSIAFVVVQWVLVTKVKMSPDQQHAEEGSAVGEEWWWRQRVPHRGGGAQ